MANGTLVDSNVLLGRYRTYFPTVTIIAPET